MTDMLGGSEPEQRETPPAVASNAEPDAPHGRSSDGVTQRFLGWRHRNEVLALSVLMLGLQFLPRRMPLGIYGLGIVSGAAIVLNAIGIVLVYRSNRVINFAQVAVGSSAALFFTNSVHYQPFLRWIDPLCPGSCNGPLAVQVNYWVSLVVALALAPLFGWLLYVVVVQRFADAPRLTLTVATIVLPSVLAPLNNALPDLLSTEEQQQALGAAGIPRLPFEFALRFGGARFEAADLATILVAGVAIAAITLYLRRSATGTAIRASAENADRAATLGINVSAVTARVWVLAGALSGLAALLSIIAGRSQGAGAVGEIRTLAAAVIAGLTHLPLLAAAAVVLGMVEQGFLWAFGSVAVFNGSLFVLIGAIMFLQHGRMSRAEAAQTGALSTAAEIRPIPPELRTLAPVKKWLRITIGVVTVLLVGLPWMLAPTEATFASLAMIYALVGLSLLPLAGWAGQISLGQMGLAGVGAFVAAAAGVPFLLAMPLGGIAGATASLVIGIPALRLRGLQLAIITLAFTVFVTSVLLEDQHLGRLLPSELPRPSVLGLDLDDPRVFYYFTLGLVALAAFALQGARQSRMARALLALRDNEHAAQSFGIDLARARIGAFAVSGFIAGWAGVVLAYHQRGIEVLTFPPDLSRTVFLHAVIGGLGTVIGPLLGFVYYAAPVLFAVFGVPAIFALLLGGPALLVLLLLVPGGLSQLVFGLRDSLLRKVAIRHNILVPSMFADTGPNRVEKAKIAPKLRPGGGAVFTPRRYELPGQWSLEMSEATTRSNSGNNR